MKEFRSFIILGYILLHTCLYSQAQELNCSNLGFENGDFTNWEGYTWVYSIKRPEINTNKVKGFVSRRHAIISDTSAYDANTGFALKKIPRGYNYSARIGDEIIMYDQNPRCWQQSLRYKIDVDANNSLLIMKFALVLQYASDHDEKNEPRFKLTLLDKDGRTIKDCSNYDVYSSNKNIKGFNFYHPEGDDDIVVWRDWTTVGADLSNYIGQTIYVEFMTGDCAQQYHYGYAYFVVSCHPSNITEKYCSGDTHAQLLAPEGFESYSWKDNSETIIDTTNSLFISNPVEGSKYSCTMVSATGCTVRLYSTINKYEPVAGFDSYMIDCTSNLVQFKDSSKSTHGTLEYIWNFGDTIEYVKDPLHKFKTSGLHQMSLIVFNPPSTCSDTLNRLVESFSPPLVGIEGYSTYCPNLSTFIKAYGAFDYTWNTGSKADSLEVGAPGGSFWLIGRSSTGCISDTIFKTVSEEPDWEFSANGDTSFCTGDTSLLQVSGGLKYLWNTGDSANFISVNSTGQYIVTGINKRGCKKLHTFNVTEHQIPNVIFSLSTTNLDKKNCILTGSILEQPDVNYSWDFGDGSTGSGPNVEHSYNITSLLLTYTVSLEARSIYNCVDSNSTVIDVTPFVPNVFSPNNDGINDLFLPDIELSVYDRNGLLLYLGNEGWNGNYKNRQMPPDTYFYLVKYKNRYQHDVIKKGYVTLVR